MALNYVTKYWINPIDPASVRRSSANWPTPTRCTSAFGLTSRRWALLLLFRLLWLAFRFLQLLSQVGELGGRFPRHAPFILRHHPLSFRSGCFVAPSLDRRAEVKAFSTASRTPTGRIGNTSRVIVSRTT